MTAHLSGGTLPSKTRHFKVAYVETSAPGIPCDRLDVFKQEVDKAWGHDNTDAVVEHEILYPGAVLRTADFADRVERSGHGACSPAAPDFAVCVFHQGDNLAELLDIAATGIGEWRSRGPFGNDSGRQVIEPDDIVCGSTVGRNTDSDLVSCHGDKSFGWELLVAVIVVEEEVDRVRRVVSVFLDCCQYSIFEVEQMVSDVYLIRDNIGLRLDFLMVYTS